MLWVALASLIMSVTGTGDDTKPVRERTTSLRQAIVSTVHDPERATHADAAVKNLEQAFAAHRERLARVSACIEKCDRSYEATRAQYEQCDQSVDDEWNQMIDETIAAEKQLRENIRDDEWPALRAALAGDEP